MIYNIIIYPIELIIDWIFTAVLTKIPQIGIIGAIVSISICISFLTLPLYNIADKIQDEERKKVKSLEKWVKHIKKTFTGDERFMMLSEYYRQNHYHPIFALRSTLSLLIQIPFFIAAYHFLRTNELLSGASWWIIKDLSQPDALIPFMSLNLLPILMTLINCISGIFYAKKLTFKEQIQTYLLALVFLVLLYNAPSGLVIYWTLNNIFSLVKNIVKNFRHKKSILYFALLSFLLLISHLFIKRRVNIKSLSLLFFTYFLTLIPIIWYSFSSTLKKEIIKKITSLKDILVKKIFISNNLFLLVTTGIGLALLFGFVLPSNIIVSSPIEFSFLGEINNPVNYIFFTLLIFFGFFVFWPTVIYKIVKSSRVFLPIILFAFYICALFNVFVFTCDYGPLDVSFKLSNPKCLIVKNALYTLLPLEIFIISVFIFIIFSIKKKLKIIELLLLSLCLGEAFLGTINTLKTNKVFEEYSLNLSKNGIKNNSKIKPEYHLSKNGKNVIVFFIDRAIGPFVEDVFNELPAMKKQYDGFIWYPNTMSFSNSTATGAPPIYGGYEYVQEEMNKRDSILLIEKNREAHLLMPRLFVDGGFVATLADPTWANFKWSGDLTGYDIYPDITVKERDRLSMYKNAFFKEKHFGEYSSSVSMVKKHLINFTFLQTSYPQIRKKFYYLCRKMTKSSKFINSAERWFYPFAYIYYLPELTDLESPKSSFICLHSNAVHDTYANPGDDFESAKPEEADFSTIIFRNQVATFKQLGKFFDYLRENNVYDNTRIIIVSDHGSTAERKNEYDDSFEHYKLNNFSALLLYKDFNSNNPIKIDNTFMTNADTPFLATQGLGLSDINPFTGKKLEQNKEKGIKSYGCVDLHANHYPEATQFELDKNNGWFVHTNIYDEKNWIRISDWEKKKAEDSKK